MHWNLTQLSLLVISFNLQLRRLTYVKKRLTYVKKKVNLPYLPEYNAGPCVNTEPNLRLHFEKKKESRKQRRPFLISLLVQSYPWISKAIDHYKINKFSVLHCMLMRDTSLKNSVNNIHFNSLDFSSGRKVHITHG